MHLSMDKTRRESIHRPAAHPAGTRKDTSSLSFAMLAACLDTKYGSSLCSSARVTSTPLLAKYNAVDTLENVCSIRLPPRAPSMTILTVPPFTQPLCSIVGISIVLYMGQNDHITGGFRLGGRIKIPHDQIRLNAQHSALRYPASQATTVSPGCRYADKAGVTGMAERITARLVRSCISVPLL